MPRLINISNRLPVTLNEDGQITTSSGGLVAALEGLPPNQFDLLWIGWPGRPVPDADQPALRDRLAHESGCRPVFLSQPEQESFYEGFSNSSLWPLLHYMTHFMRYDPAWWDAYRAVNQRFADETLEVAQDGDLVWVHDYQLMLLPALLRARRPSLKIGFFLHTPFPSYEIFRTHPNRTPLLEGVLGADLVGFHTPGYMRHFRSACLRLLGAEGEVTRIRHRHGHATTLGVYPIGINAKKFEEGLRTDSFRKERETLRQTFGHKRLVLSVERLDYTKGIPHRLDAVETFLADWPHPDDIKFLFVAVPSREAVSEYQQLREEVESRVGRINGKYATLQNSPIHFIHGTVEFDQLLALYAESEVAVVTPLMDGMNLVAKEFVAAQPDEQNPGVLVLSEFAGAAEELYHAVIVNPYDVRGVAAAIRTALEMPADERRRRMRPMHQRVLRYDAAAWARQFITDLQRDHLEPAHPHDPHEAVETIRAAVAAGRRVAIFLDYDGTLREIVPDPHAACPTQGILGLLARLGARPNVDVTVISGRRAEDLDAWLGHCHLGLVAEHGAALRRPGQDAWERLDRNVTYSWKDQVGRVLRVYEDSVPGSFIEDKRTSLVWHYRKSDPEFARWKANHLAAELANLTSNDPLEVRHGKKIVEVTASQVNKGAAVLQVMGDRKYDLVVVAGDDLTDESMFRLAIPNLVSIKIGPGQTHARYRLPNPSDLRHLMEQTLPERTNARPPQPSS